MPPYSLIIRKEIIGSEEAILVRATRKRCGDFFSLSFSYFHTFSEEIIGLEKAILAEASRKGCGGFSLSANAR